ncbi:hypothetical protein ADL34_21600 [Streptomyces sp. NRRL WC-3605]|nr:hypothetical protein ADL34_21600 [Streptomyces sp. NRRL WC-3605]KUL74219.1 hypothetical protein ADL33_18195 [Streptomyces sp. NRRL WC-3604]
MILPLWLTAFQAWARPLASWVMMTAWEPWPLSRRVFSRRLKASRPLPMSLKRAPSVFSMRSRPPLSPRSDGLPSASRSGVRAPAAVGLPAYVSTVERAVSTQLLLRPGASGPSPLMRCTHGPSAGSGGRVGSPFASRGTEFSRASCSARVGSVTPPGGFVLRVSEAGVGTSLGFAPSGVVLWWSGVVGPPESGLWGAEGVGCPLGVVVTWWIGTGVTCDCCW